MRKQIFLLILILFGAKMGGAASLQPHEWQELPPAEYAAKVVAAKAKAMKCDKAAEEEFDALAIEADRSYGGNISGMANYLVDFKLSGRLPNDGHTPTEAEIEAGKKDEAMKQKIDDLMTNIYKKRYLRIETNKISKELKKNCYLAISYDNDLKGEYADFRDVIRYYKTFYGVSELQKFKSKIAFSDKVDTESLKFSPKEWAKEVADVSKKREESKGNQSATQCISFWKRLEYKNDNMNEQQGKLLSKNGESYTVQVKVNGRKKTISIEASQVIKIWNCNATW